MSTFKMTVKKLMPYVIVMTIMMMVFEWVGFHQDIQEQTTWRNTMEYYVMGSGSLLFFGRFLVIGVTFGWLCYSEGAHGYIEHISYRRKGWKYRAHIILTSFVLCMLSVFLLYLSKYVMLDYFSADMNIIHEPGLDGSPFSDVSINQPLLFAVGYALWEGFIYGLHGAFSAVMSTAVTNFFVISLSPILFHFIEDALVYKIPFLNQSYSILYARGLYSFSPPDFLLMVLFNGPMIYILCMIAIFLIGEQRRKREC